MYFRVGEMRQRKAEKEGWAPASWVCPWRWLLCEARWQSGWGHVVGKGRGSSRSSAGFRGREQGHGEDCFSFFLSFKNFIGIESTYKSVLIKQQSSSVKHMNISIPFQILFLGRLLHSIEWTSLCCTISPCYSCILYTVVCIYQSQLPNLSPPCHISLLGKHNYDFEIFESALVL